jgi:hypothetical protein
MWEEMWIGNKNLEIADIFQGMLAGKSPPLF